jgi:hypothetical protein
VNNISSSFQFNTKNWLVENYGLDNVISYNTHSGESNTFTIITDVSDYEKHIKFVFDKFKDNSKKMYILGHITDAKNNKIFGKSQYYEEYVEIPRTKVFKDLFLKSFEHNIEKYENTFASMRNNILENFLSIDDDKIH